MTLWGAYREGSSGQTEVLALDPRSAAVRREEERVRVAGVLGMRRTAGREDLIMGKPDDTRRLTYLVDKKGSEGDFLPETLLPGQMPREGPISEE